MSRRRCFPTLLALGAASLLSGCVAAPVIGMLSQGSLASATSCQSGGAVGQTPCNGNPLTALLGNWAGQPAATPVTTTTPTPIGAPMGGPVGATTPARR